MNEKKHDLTERDCKMLEHVARYRIATDAIFRTVFFPNVAALRSRAWVDRGGYTYGLQGTPTTFTLEQRLATLEGGRHALLVSSGLAAITLVDIALLASGDQLVLPDNAYGPNKTFTRHELAQWGIAHALYDPLEPATLRHNVTSPGGTTAAALGVLMGPDGLAALMERAVAAATKRSRELAG